MKKTFLASLVGLMFAAATASTHAAIVIGNTGSSTTFNGGNLNTFGDIANTDSVLFFFFAKDSASAPTSSATYGTQTVTLVQNTGWMGLGYVINPEDNGTLSLTVPGGDPPTLAYYGVASGVDTTDIKTALGTAISGSTQTNTALTGLVSGDVVFSGFSVNNSSVNTYSGNTNVAIVDGGSTNFDGVIRQFDITTDGSFSPTATLTSGASTANSRGASIAFTAIPEPSTSALLIAGVGMLALGRRRK